MGKEPRIRFIDIPESIRTKYQYCTRAEITKLRAAGFQDQFVSVEDGVRDYMQNYLQRA
jgi:ADP-L-glycero-D-manno-heptose 6-epimerase